MQKKISTLGKIGAIMNIVIGVTIIIIFGIPLLYAMNFLDSIAASSFIILIYFTSIFVIFIGLPILMLLFNILYLITGKFKITSAIFGLILFVTIITLIGSIFILIPEKKVI